MSGQVVYVAASLLWLAGLTAWTAWLTKKKHRRERQLNDKIMRTIRVIAEAQKELSEARKEDEGR